MADFQNLSALLQRFAVENGQAGCACAVAQGGKTLYEGYYGYADLEQEKPITKDTVYRLYSMTKVIVCTAALMLFERGRFLLDDPVYEYFPEYKNSKVYVTDPNGRLYEREAKSPLLIKHALSMSAGLPYSAAELPTGRKMKNVKAELIKKHRKYDIVTEVRAMGSVPLAFDPGTRWMYGYGHDLVAGLIEVVSGKTVGEFLQEEIFDPLGMKDTGYRYRAGIEERMASCYLKDEEGKVKKISPLLEEFHQPDAIYESGGAGLYSTLEDYLKFSQMLANKGTLQGQRIIGRKTVDLLRANQLNETQLEDFRNPYLAGYGYGLGVRTLLSPAAALSNGSPGEFGWSGMLGTYVSIDPQEEFSVVYMQQVHTAAEHYHHLRLRAVANGCLV